MTTTIASNLLKTVCIIEGMMGEINAKTILLKGRMKTQSENPTNQIIVKVLESEVDNLNVLMELIENIYSELDEKTAA